MRLVLVSAAIFALGAFAPAKAESVLHLISPCAPADILGFGFSDFKGSSPVFVDGKPMGELAVCDAKSFRLAPGKHNIRVKLAGKSDYGISSDAGMDVTLTAKSAYLVMTSDSFASASLVSEARGQDYLSGVRKAKGR